MDIQVLQGAWEAHHQQLRAYLISLTHDADDAEDLAQEAYARLAREIDRGRAPLDARAWLFQVARNRLVSDSRRRKVAERHRQFSASDRHTGSAEEEVLRSEQNRELRALLAQLDPIDRRSIVMASLGYSGAEIGKVVGRSENAVRTRLCRARMRLRVQLQTGA